MSIDWGDIRWSKAAKARAAEMGKALWAFGTTGRHLPSEQGGFGEMELIGPMDVATAEALNTFAIELRTGKTPREAFDAAWPEKVAGTVA